MMSRINDVKNRVGRPEVDSEAVTVRMQRNLLDALDDWRLHQNGKPGRPEAIRQIIAKSLKSS